MKSEGRFISKILVIEAGAKFEGKSKTGDVKDITETNTKFQSDTNTVK